MRSGSKNRFLGFIRAVALLSVMFGSMALIVSLAALEGFDTELRENAVKFTSHITVRSFGNNPMPHRNLTTGWIKSHFPEVTEAKSIIEREGLARSRKGVEGVNIRGVEATPGEALKLISGKSGFDSPNAREAFIGQRLAEKLDVKAGDSLVVFALVSQDYHTGELPETRIMKFKLIGTYRSGMAQYDDLFIYIPINSAASLFEIAPTSATTFELKLKDITLAPESARRIESQLGMPYFATTVYQMHNSIFAWIDLQKEPIPIVLALISLVAMMNIVTALLIAVVEKTHSIGILRALGLRRRDLIGVFLSQGGFIGFAGSIAGCALALAFSLVQKHYELISLKGDIYFLDALPIEIVPWHYALVISASFALSLAATLIPAYIASRISPVRAIRFN